MATPVLPPLYSILYRNEPSQKLFVYAWDDTSGAAKTGDAGNISAAIDKDDAGSVATNDGAPTEVDAANHPGWYVFNLTTAETDASVVLVTPVSGTANIVLSPVCCVTLPSVRRLAEYTLGDL